MISRFIRWQEEANERLVEAANTAVSAGKAKSRFLAQMSHEIRTPINAVLGMNEMILRESDDNSIKEYAVNIQSAGRNLLSLINSILDFSKIEEGKMEIMPVKYDSSIMIENVINSVTQRADDKGLIFESHIDENIPSWLYGDDMRVAQVIVNLLTNAVKYTNKGRVDLYITGEKKNEKTVSLGVKVKDTGIGIKQEDLGKLFESFTRLEETRNRAIEGTGLGMSIVIRLLDMMNSKLEVESEYGKGSEFSFKVDQMIIDEKPIGDFKQRAKEAADKTGKDTYLYATGARVLVVDDNEMNLKVIKNLLKLNGIVPDMAESGEIALEMMSKVKYHVVLLDHMMPKMDGVETLKKAKEDKIIDSFTAVIALTANAVVGAKESYLKAGFDDYLSKPVEIKALEAALAKYLPQNMIEYRSKKNKQENKSQSSHPEENVIEFKESNEDQEQFEIFEFYPGDEPEGEIEEKEPVIETAKDIYQLLNEKEINTSEGLNYCGGDPSFYKEILNDYASTADDRIKELEEAIKNHDLNTYSIKVHALKSVAKTVGDRKVFDMALALETDSKAGKEKDVLQKHPDLIKEYSKKAEFIKNLLPNEE